MAFSNNHTLISRATKVTGDIYFTGELQLEGKVTGNIIAEAFRVSPIKKPRGFVVKFKTRQDYENWRRDQKNPRLW